jgi:hypothetical protein
MEISSRILVQKEISLVYQTLLDLSNLPKIFDHILEILEQDKTPIDQIGKRYLERTESVFFHVHDVNLLLIALEEDSMICFQSDHRFFCT